MPRTRRRSMASVTGRLETDKTEGAGILFARSVGAHTSSGFDTPSHADPCPQDVHGGVCPPISTDLAGECAAADNSDDDGEAPEVAAAPTREQKWSQLESWVQLSVAVADVLSLHQQLQEIQSRSDFTAQRQPSSRRARPYSQYTLDNNSDAESEVDPDSDSDYVPSDVDIPSDVDSDDDGYESGPGRRIPRVVPALVVAATGRRSVAEHPRWQLDAHYADTVAQQSVPSRKRPLSPGATRSPGPADGAANIGAEAHIADVEAKASDAEANSSDEEEVVELRPSTRRVTRSSAAKARVPDPEPILPQAKKARKAVGGAASKASRTVAVSVPPVRAKDARSKTSIGRWLDTVPEQATVVTASAPDPAGPSLPRHFTWAPSSVLSVRESVRMPHDPPKALPLAPEQAIARGSKRRGKGKASLPRRLQDAETRAMTHKKDVLRYEKNHDVEHASRKAQLKARSSLANDDEIRKLYGSNVDKILKNLTTVKSSVQLTKLLNGHSYFVGTSKYHASQLATSSGQAAHVPLDSNCNRLVRKLVRRDNYTYVSNDETKAQACFDKDGKMFALKAMPPPAPWYRESIAVVTTLANELRNALHLASNSPNSGRNTRGNFSRFTFGTSFGGGQKKPTRISPDWTPQNEQLIVQFLSNPHVLRVLQHVEAVVFMFYPHLAKKYREMQSKIKVPDVLRGLGINLPFAAHTFNLGPYVTCWFHRDARNFVLGICPVLVLGNFNHRTSGHFIMVEPKIIMELRPGDLLIMMSAILTHGNAPLRPGETRLSWTFFSAGGLFRWVAAGCRLVSELSAEEFETYKATAADMLKEAWASIPTYHNLKQFWEKSSQ